MIYLKGPDKLERQLDAFGLTKSPESADCAVIQMPGNVEVFGNLPAGLPVLVVVNGMMSLVDTRAIRKFGGKIVKEEDLAGEIQGLQKNEEEDDVIQFSYDEEATPKVEPKEEVKPAPRATRDIRQTRSQEVRPPEPKATQEVRPPQRKAQDDVMMPIMRVRPDTRTPVFEEEPAPPQREVKEAPVRRQQILNPRTTRGLVVTSYSSSGGVGKTFMACSIGALCAMINVSTVLVDLDLGFGNIDIETGLVDEVDRGRTLDKRTTPKSNWATVTDWRKHAVDLKSNTLRHNSGLYVVPSYPYAGKELPEAEVEDLLHTLSEMYDLVVVDLGVDGFSNQSRVALRMSNAILIVAGQDPKTIGKLTHFMTQEGGKNERMHLVFNKRTPTGYYNPKEVAKKMMFEKYYAVPLDEEGVNTARLQHKLVVQVPGSVAGEAVRNFAAAVLPFKIDAGEIIQQKKSIGILTKLMQGLKGLKRA